MRILLTTEQYPPDSGGIGAVTHGFALSLAERGHEVRVLSTQNPCMEWHDQDGISIRGAKGSARRFIKIAAIASAMSRILREFQPHLIFASAYRPTGLPAAFLSPSRGIPLVTYIHGTELLTEAPNPLRRALMRHALRGSALLIANSRNTARLTRATFPGPLPNIEVIHPGIDTRRFAVAPEPEGPPVLLTLSNLTHRKGTDLVIQALARLRATGFPDARLLIAGDGPSRPALENQVRILNLSGAVDFLGAVSPDEVPELMSRCHVFILASREKPRDLESFGIVYLEAGASGRPVVGTRIGGVPEAIAEGETGLLVPPDEPIALSDAIADLLRDQEKRALMGRNGRKHALRFDWSNQAENLEGILNGIGIPAS